MRPISSDPSVTAAQAGLLRAYLDVFAFVRHRAAQADPVARGFERELTLATMPPPSHQQVCSWLANLSAGRGIGSRSNDPYTARQLLLGLQAAERNGAAIGPTVWAQAVAQIKAGAQG